MKEITIKDTVGDILVSYPILARVFEKKGIDYCCGGKKSLQEACEERKQDPEDLLSELREAATEATDSSIDPSRMSLTDLSEHIEKTHHDYLRNELPRLDMVTERVAQVHGQSDPRLVEVRQAFIALSQELMSHMVKEERVLFPMIRELESADSRPGSHHSSIAAPINQMESEHDDAGSVLSQIRLLTDNLTPPDWACNTYRVMLDGLARLEKDLHWHIHKENNVLFPRALELEANMQEKLKLPTL